MKIASKITLSMSVLIAVVFSVVGYLMIEDSFSNSYHTVIEQNVNQHTLERYAVESYINKQLENEAAVSEDIIAESLHSLTSFMDNDQRFIAAYKQDKNLLYSDSPHPISKVLQNEALQEVPQENGKAIHRIADDNGRKKMLITTYLEKGMLSFYLVSAYDIQQIYDQRSSQLQSFYLLDFTLMFTSMLVIYAFTRVLTRPIDRLRIVSGKIANGAYDERCNIDSQDEIGELSKSFDQMAQAIEEKISLLQRSAEEKDEFIASFTHEIKTPMTAIIGYSDLLRKDMLQEVDKKQMALEFIFHEAKRLEGLSHSLLDFLLVNHQNVELQPVSIKELFTSLQKDMKEVYPDGEFAFSPLNVNVYGEISLLDCLFRNLITNAYRAHGTHIEICAEDQGEQILLHVKDNGCGIPKEELQFIKEAFYRVDKSRSRQQGGNGLGLAICDAIAKLHHSDLLIESEENVGTTITITLQRCSL